MERKKLLALCGSICLALILIVLPVMAGCKGAEEVVEEGEKKEEKEEVVEELPEIKIIYPASSASTDYGNVYLREEMMPWWDELTPNYKIVFEGHYGGEIFPGVQAGEACSIGTVQMTGTGSYRDEALEPRFGINLAPGLWNSFEHYIRFYASPEYQKVIKDHEKNGIKITHFTVYYMWLSFLDKEVHTLEDLAGLRIRTMESPTMGRAIELLGANPIKVKAGELTMAMQTHMFDGMIASLGPAWMRMLGYLDYNNYVLEFPITVTSTASGFNTEWYNNLPDEVRLAFEEKVLPEWAIFSQHSSDVDRAEGKALWRKEATSVKVTEAEYAKFIEALMPLYDEIDAKLGGGIIDACFRTREQEGCMGFTNWAPFDEKKSAEMVARLEAGRVDEGRVGY